jgi:hypothetical protein
MILVNVLGPNAATAYFYILFHKYSKLNFSYCESIGVQLETIQDNSSPQDTIKLKKRVCIRQRQ